MRSQVSAAGYVPVTKAELLSQAKKLIPLPTTDLGQVECHVKTRHDCMTLMKHLLGIRALLVGHDQGVEGLSIPSGCSLVVLRLDAQMWGRGLENTGKKGQIENQQVPQATVESSVQP
jgi:hypothetical protein